MIYPEEDDIGRAVVGNRGKLEEGVITSFNDHSVFVRYGADLHSKGNIARRSGMGEALKERWMRFFFTGPA